MRAMRIGIVAVGVLLALGGWAGRSIESEYGVSEYESVFGESGVVSIFEVHEPDATFEIEELDGSTAVVYAVPDGGGERDLVFTGTPDEAAEFYEKRDRALVFQGTNAEADVWLESHAQEASMLVPNLVIAAGVMIALLGAALIRIPKHGRDSERQPIVSE